ncbi:FbpB family small basic protein [Bacillus sp. HMF5848]|uniref:FbpB family small basic protein n=1 Tax=Bacillus sp. HMF5848 TaxID=2495421 RepID=UPI000F78FDAB|nr:FbpB family small basic protein [Bacillus sp. HMF5848]RSK29143.1 FbpB family small basic protein [Bacillus sp. HMF5848]
MRKFKTSFYDLIEKNKQELLKDKDAIEKIEIRIEGKHHNDMGDNLKGNSNEDLLNEIN